MARKQDNAPTVDSRTQPHNLEAERAVLGTFLLREAALTEVQAILSPEDFYDPRHQEIFALLIEIQQRGEPIDPIVLVNEFSRRGDLEKVGGAAYLAALEQSVISPDNVGHHAQIVHEKSLLRKLIQASSAITEDAMTENKDTDALLKESEQRIFEILTGRATSEFRSIGEDASEVYQELEKASENRQDVTGVPTGLLDLDTMTGGLQPSDLVILAARPSVGKTSLALNIAAAAAHSHYKNHPGAEGPPGVAIFSLEMNRRQVITRMVCTKAGIPMELVRKNMLNANQLAKFAETLQDMSDLDVFINDTPGVSPVEMRLHAQRLKARCPNLSLIVVDYLQLMSGSSNNRSESRQQEVSEISRSLKALARDLNVPVLALSQLSRGIESRRGSEARPRLSDLRESGAIEQDADVVMFIHRINDREMEEMRQAGDASVLLVDLIIAKQRNGPVGTCHLVFREDITHFAKLTAGVGPQ